MFPCYFWPLELVPFVSLQCSLHSRPGIFKGSLHVWEWWCIFTCKSHCAVRPLVRHLMYCLNRSRVEDIRSVIHDIVSLSYTVVMIGVLD